MDDVSEHGSSLNFASSSYVSNGSGSYSFSVSSTSEPGTQFTYPRLHTSNMEVISLHRLSTNLERLLLDSEFNCSDVEIKVEGIAIGAHRCILASRSPFFHRRFCQDRSSSRQEGKLKYDIKELVPNGNVGHDAFMIFLNYLYTGRLKPSPAEVSACVDSSCNHDACRPAINFAVELVYASSTFEIKEMVSLWQRHLFNFVEKAFIEDVIPILLAACSCKLSHLLTNCIQRIARSDLDQLSMEKELPCEVVDEITSLRRKLQIGGPENPAIDPIQEKNIKRIHKALDSDDVELVGLLLKEGNTTLDDAHALHYAAAYCDSKIVAELLDLKLADVNLRNRRGYTVIHVAARRREPAILVSLLTKGACASAITNDGRTAVQICQQLTRAKDYFARTEQGKESNKDRICIDILKREEGRSPLIGDSTASLMESAEDFHLKLLHLEDRVAFARLLFPAEAKLAMEIAQTETTSEFAGLSANKRSGNLRQVDLNETPSMADRKLQSRMSALLKTVELGRRYFPHCSQVLDKFMEDDLPDLFYLERGTPDEQKIKRQRFSELKDDVIKAFSKDKAGSGLASSSSSSSSMKDGVKRGTRK
ncbi:BTB/POZ domain and ankyrin repeat-containing protein NPR1-like [Nymphaea colorata]|nr:BTB/POZ domain and ankyrin repeat-containing protein NPR1-like [Nymphaea colorata]